MTKLFSDICDNSEEIFAKVLNRLLILPDTTVLAVKMSASTAALPAMVNSLAVSSVEAAM